jgi:predicted dehydrogenase
VTVGVGVIGTGFGRRVVAPVFASTDGCRVVDVVSARDETAVRALVARDDVDLVCVHSPPFLHERDVGYALDAGKAVLCDKPFAVAGDDVARGDGVRLVNFEFRHQPARLVVRDALARVGPVEHVAWSHVSAGTRVPLRPYGWLFDAARGGGWIGAWASHAVDTLRFMFAEVDAVVDATRHLYVPERDGERCSAEDGLTATLRMANGATVAIDSTYAAPVSLPPRFAVFGRDGAIQCIADERVTLLHPDGRREELRAPSPPLGADRHDEAMRAWACVVRDCVRTGIVSAGVPTFADGVACDVVLAQLRAAPLVP